jgi:hypothetical protein
MFLVALVAVVWRFWMGAAMVAASSFVDAQVTWH